MVLMYAIGGAMLVIVIMWLVINTIIYTSHWYYKITGRHPLRKRQAIGQSH